MKHEHVIATYRSGIDVEGKLQIYPTGLFRGNKKSKQ